MAGECITVPGSPSLAFSNQAAIMAGLGGIVLPSLTHEHSLLSPKTCQCKRLSIFVTPSKVVVPISKTQVNSMRTLWQVFAMIENPVRRQHSRHIDIRRYFARELVMAVFVELISFCTHKMVADALTTNLPSPTFIGPGHRRVMMGQTPFALKFVRSKCA